MKVGPRTARQELPRLLASCKPSGTSAHGGVGAGPTLIRRAAAPGAHPLCSLPHARSHCRAPGAGQGLRAEAARFARQSQVLQLKNQRAGGPCSPGKRSACCSSHPEAGSALRGSCVHPHLLPPSATRAENTDSSRNEPQPRPAGSPRPRAGRQAPRSRSPLPPPLCIRSVCCEVACSHPARVTWPGCYEWSRDTARWGPQSEALLGEGTVERGGPTRPTFSGVGASVHADALQPPGLGGQAGRVCAPGKREKAAGAGGLEGGPVAEKRTQPVTLLTRAAADFGLQGLPVPSSSRPEASSQKVSQTSTPPPGECKHRKGGKEL